MGLCGSMRKGWNCQLEKELLACVTACRRRCARLRRQEYMLQSCMHAFHAQCGLKRQHATTKRRARLLALTLSKRQLRSPGV